MSRLSRRHGHVMYGDLRQSDGAGVGEDAEVDHDVGEVEPDQEPEDM